MNLNYRSVAIRYVVPGILGVMFALLVPVFDSAAQQSPYVVYPEKTPLPSNTKTAQLGRARTDGEGNTFNIPNPVLTPSYVTGVATPAFNQTPVAVLTNTGRGRIVNCYNDLDQPVNLVFGDVSNPTYLPEQTGVVIDFAANGRAMSSNITVAAPSSTPASGRLSCTVTR